MTPKRQQVQDYVLKVMSMQDGTNYNTQVYIDLFNGMSDEQFHAWMETLRDNKHAKLTFLAVPFKVVISLSRALEASKFLGVEIMERLRLWDPISKRYCLTPEKYMILRLPVRRLKQYLMDGLSVPDSDKRLNPLTDQVVKPDKGSAISFPQAQMIAEKGLTNTLHELITVRGGNLEAYAKMKTEIEETGESDISVVDNTQGVRSGQTLRSLFYAMHLDTNI